HKCGHSCTSLFAPTSSVPTPTVTAAAIAGAAPAASASVPSSGTRPPQPLSQSPHSSH
ncbi:unnamed protein product, partial [Closterium sp. Naga37s-1]